MTTIRLPNGTVLIDGEVVHRPPPPAVVREVRHVNLGTHPLTAAIGRVLYG